MMAHKSYAPLLRLWMLRLMVKHEDLLGGRYPLHSLRDYIVRMLRLLGVDEKLLHDADGKLLEASEIWHEKTGWSIMQDLHQKLELMESEPPVLPEDCALARNLAALSERIGLKQIERDIFLVLIMTRQEPNLDILLRGYADITKSVAMKILGAILSYPDAGIQQAMGKQGILYRSGLARMNKQVVDFTRKFDVLHGLTANMMEEHENALGLLKGHMVPSQPGQRVISDYRYLEEDVDIIVNRLKNALKDQLPGVNILIHGLPGTGKTELARAVAKEIEVNAFDVADSDQDGEVEDGWGRIKAYQISQAMLSGGCDNLIIFDEIEDVFLNSSRGIFNKNTSPAGCKSWMNSILEENPVPAIWLSNDIGPIDPAYLRRFDYVVEMKAPPRQVREKLLNNFVGEGKVSAQWIKQVAECEHLTPALIERSAKVFSAMGDGLAAEQQQSTLKRIIDAGLRAQGYGKGLQVATDAVLDYHPEWLSADCNLDELCEGLMQTQEGRLCFYGPSGTGKTAFGRHLAERLGKPLLVKRTSDLLSMWVGGSEKNIAAAFEQASRDSAVLLIDEADSFLQDRGKAKASWQVTQVNEMLTSMERFEGVFIASTNLMESLDASSLRRFDLKIKFDYLGADQAWNFFSALVKDLNLALDGKLMASLAELDKLTPGDFALVRRQTRLRPLQTAQEVLNSLRMEQQAKPGGQVRKMGF